MRIALSVVGLVAILLGVWVIVAFHSIFAGTVLEAMGLAFLIGGLIAHGPKSGPRTAEGSGPASRSDSDFADQIGDAPTSRPIAVFFNTTGTSNPAPALTRRCQYCKSVYPVSNTKCPQCGAPS